MDVTSPQSFVSSMVKSNTEGNDFIGGLGAALFAKQGGIVGGVPILGDLGRFAGDNPLVSTLYKVPGVAADIVGGAA
ncbi:MAG TPA: hypothetical protein VFI15_04755, partial [Candidatus Limnocylindrales bacterium]|nr:hypothetical protein [Candidatus Limnocylindrales bacterium]